MAELKTKQNAASVKKFLNGIKDEKRRKECDLILGMMEKAVGEKERMWGSSIVGFGKVHYRYASGREGDWFQMGFSPRKQNLTLYILSGKKGEESLLQKLGKYKTGKSCLYINSLDEVDLSVLERLILNGKEGILHQ